jgi:1,2-diacylglycerol 3-alpha-glucosyltransferase
LKNGAAKASTVRSGRARYLAAVEGMGETPASVHPFTALFQRQGRPLRIAIVSDFVRIPYANGAAFQTRFLYQELRRCGHEVTVIGAEDPEARPDELAPGTIQLPSVPLKTYPGLYLPVPTQSWVADPDRWNFDIVFAQATSFLLYFALWLREMKGTPVLFVNTTHLAAAYDVLLPESLAKYEAVHFAVNALFKRPYEKTYSSIYNDSDGLVVLSEGLRDYWRERGVTVPIHVIPRAVQPQVFDRPLGEDPFLALGIGDGPRLLCAGRHTREKSQDRLIRIFAQHVLPRDPTATLTLLGAGPDTELYKRVAVEQGVADKVIFPGEVPFTQMVDWYAHADLFAHASLSETYGNVLGEALWCGTPTVAFADGMGVTAQMTDDVNGVLLSPGAGEVAQKEADEAFGRAVHEVLEDPARRARYARSAASVARASSSPAAVQQKLANAFQHAQDHAAASALKPSINRGRASQWLTTMKRFRPWLTLNYAVYLFGHLRPSKQKTQNTAHPQIGS